jgi:aminopeptidase N
MKSDSAPTIFLKDYTPPPFLVDTVQLDVDFQTDGVLVTANLAIRRNPAARNATAALILDGDALQTVAVAIDDVVLEANRYVVDAATLTIDHVPDAFALRTVVRIRPDDNTRLSGLYRSADGYFTQCEAEGFRRITWFPDRPDVMSRYTVTLHADRELLPLLLSNGNPVTSGSAENGRHWARWEDPFPKPCYLFALVAARLESLHDRYVTNSGRSVNLAIYVEPGKLDQCDHAMAALKKSMRWDEQTFGLECDLDHYMIVAVGDFNMGAMENKGLNIFNTKYVLARPDVATDADYENIDRVVGHEYFHNWTGNRITCRDWFQLSLKEGLTVFRDQEFGADIHSRAVTRIRDVRNLRAAQFPEDAGPMAHPVRPSSYVEINNFYTATVYEKGAEVVRMIRTLIGKDAFRRGMDLYFQRHDGHAVTCDEFAAAMADASGIDLRQFMRWYDQGGTPHINARGDYDAATRRYRLTLRQATTALPGAAAAQPFHIPVAVGLLGPGGKDLPLRLAGEALGADIAGTRILSLVEPEQQFVFEEVPSSPVPSLLRGFSAPVVLDFPYSDQDLAHLLAHDSDPFGRWEAGQMLAGRLILDGAKRIAAGSPPLSMQWPASFALAVQRVIESAGNDPAYAAEVLSLPTEATLAEQMETVDPEALHAARNSLRRFVAGQLAPLLHNCYRQFATEGTYSPDPAANGRRALRNACLAYLNETETTEARALAVSQFESADNMTDQFAALAVLAQYDSAERVAALEAFHARWQSEALVVDKWLAVQAGSRRSSALSDVKQLLDHPSFDLRNPNKVYSLLRTFGNNHVRFHAADGAGYRFVAEQTQRLDAFNPQVAARLARCFDRWRKFDKVRQAHALAALENLRGCAGLSSDVLEIVERALR